MGKAIISISIDKDLLKKIEKKKREKKAKSRSEMMEYLLGKGIGNKSDKEKKKLEDLF